MKYLVVLSFFPWIWFYIWNKPGAQPAWPGCLWLVKTLSCSRYLGCPNAASSALLGTPGVWVSQTGKIPTSKRLAWPVKPILSFSVFWLLMWGSNSVPANSRTCTGQVCLSALPFPTSHLVAQQDEKVVHAFAICHIKQVLKPAVGILVENRVFLKLSSFWMESSTFLSYSSAWCFKCPVFTSSSCHGAGICSVDPCCCCSAWCLWSSACLRWADVSSCAGQVHHHPSCTKGFLAPKSCFSPHINWRCQRCLRPSGSHVARKGLGETGGYGPLPACRPLFVSWRWSPIYGQTSLVFPLGRGKRKKWDNRTPTSSVQMGKKLTKLPK